MAEGSSSTQVQYSPQEQAARDRVAAEGMAAFDKSKAFTDSGQYPGARVAGFSPMTEGSWAEMLGAGRRIQAGTDAAQGANNFGLHDAMFASSNPYLQNAMDAATRPMIEQFTEAGGPLQAIRGSALQSGGYGGSRQGIAEGIATKGLMNKVGDMRSTMANEGYKLGLEQMNNSIKNQAMLAMLQQMPGQIQSGIGAQQDAKSQQQENYAGAQRDFQMNGQWAPLQNMANIVYGGSNGKTTTTSEMPEEDTTMQTVGTVGSLAMMAMMAGF